jgi:protein-S-isoprenylcysteine O-methyltransferase Ste14
MRKDWALTPREHPVLRRIHKWRGRLAYVPPLIVMTVCFWGEYENDLIIWPLGLSLLGLGFVVRIWATRHIGRRIPRKHRGGCIHPLVITGPYSLVRNPLYLGNMIGMMGLCVLSKLVWLMPAVFIYAFFIYSLVVRYEEYKLLALFGKGYETYCQHVPRWIPRFTSLRSKEGWGFKWSKAITGELRGVASTFPMILILLAKELFRIGLHFI